MRKEKIVTIKSDDQNNRDRGKTFHIKEMSSGQAERWAFRAFQALAKGGVELDPGVVNTGMAGMAVMGLRALVTVPYYEAIELFDELFSCVSIIRDVAHPEVRMPLLEDDVEEVGTRIELKAEVFELHTGFSFAGLKQKLTSDPAKTEENISSTQTSQG